MNVCQGTHYELKEDVINMCQFGKTKLFSFAFLSSLLAVIFLSTLPTSKYQKPEYMNPLVKELISKQVKKTSVIADGIKLLPLEALNWAILYSFSSSYQVYKCRYSVLAITHCLQSNTSI